jgi:hypothetical protein
MNANKMDVNLKIFRNDGARRIIKKLMYLK